MSPVVQSGLKAQVVYFPENDKSVCYLKNTDEVNSVELFDLNGRKLALFENHQQTEMRLDLNAFSKGMYLLRIKSKNNHLIYYKIWVV